MRDLLIRRLALIWPIACDHSAVCSLAVESWKLEATDVDLTLWHHGDQHHTLQTPTSMTWWNNCHLLARGSEICSWPPRSRVRVLVSRWGLHLVLFSRISFQQVIFWILKFRQSFNFPKIFFHNSVPGSLALGTRSHRDSVIAQCKRHLFICSFWFHSSSSSATVCRVWWCSTGYCVAG